MSEFRVIYRESLFFYYLGAFLFFLMSVFFIFTAFIKDNGVLKDVIIGTTVSIGFFFCCIAVIVLNKGREKYIYIHSNTLEFFSNPWSRVPTIISRNALKGELVMTRKGIKVLCFSSDGRKYRIPDVNFSEEEFSKICNLIVKVSRRCKACQSSRVTWNGDSGHCYNCETITPLNADEFEWKNAYQA